MGISAEQIVSDINEDSKDIRRYDKKTNDKYMTLFAEYLIDTNEDLLQGDKSLQEILNKGKNKFQKIFYFVSYFTNSIIVFRGSDDEVVWKLKKYSKVYPIMKPFVKKLKTSIKRILDPSTCILETSVILVSQLLSIPNIMSQSFYKFYSNEEMSFKRIEQHRQNVLISLPSIFSKYKIKLQDEYKLSSSIFMLGEIKLFSDPNSVIDLKYEYFKDIKRKLEMYDKCCILQLIIVNVKKGDDIFPHQNFLVFRKNGNDIEVDRYEPHGFGSMTEDSEIHMNKYLSMIGSTLESKLSFIGDRSVSLQRMMNDEVGFCSTVSMYMMLVFATAYILYDNTTLSVHEWISNIDVFIHRTIESKSRIAFGSSYQHNTKMIYYYLFASIIESMKNNIS